MLNMEKKDKKQIESAEPTELTFAEDAAPQPGAIEDQQAYDAATASGQVAEINPKNIIFVGDGEPTMKIHGVFKAELPDAATQKAGFYHPKARQIIQLFSKQYKRFVRKGDK